LFGLTDPVTVGSKVSTLQWAAGGLILAAWEIHNVSNDAGDAVAATSGKQVASVSATF
jgi:hypothetical protein